MKRLTTVQATVLTMVLATTVSANGQEPPVVVEIDTGGIEWVRKDDPVRIVLDRLPDAGEGHLAVLVGDSDVTDIFRVEGTSLVYRPELSRLPAGETEVAVFLVSSGGDWTEIGRQPLKVLHKGGFESAEVATRVDAESLGTLDDGPGETGTETGFRNATGQLDIRGSVARSGWRMQTGLNVVGVTDQQQALRFGTEGEDAPKVDLSRWSLRLDRGKGFVELGHLSYGSSRYLVNGMSSRGIAAGAPLGKWGEVSVAAVNGTSIVGWNNFIGLQESKHQIYAGTIGIETVPSRPGLFRLEATLLDGTILPLANFNQGVVNDREESQGWSFGFSSAFASQRVRLTGGYAENEFTNPADPTLSQGNELVAVVPETREAYFVEAGFDILQNRMRGERLPFTLTLDTRHERVEPLYRSVAAFVQADTELTGADVRATLGPMSFQLGYSDSHDNLDSIPSILTTNTARRNASLTLPLGQLGQESTRWLPTFTYAFDRTHQFGDGVPIDGGFNPSHVPNQVSLSHNAGLQWQGNTWSFGYRLSFSDQDNRQPGRENADFEVFTNALNLFLTPSPQFDIGLDLSTEDGDNIELDQTTEILRYGIAIGWRITDWTVLTARASQTNSELPGVRSNDDSLIDAQWSINLDRRRGERHGLGAQLYIRYFYSKSENRDAIFEIDDTFSSWSLSSGINLSVY